MSTNLGWVIVAVMSIAVWFRYRKQPTFSFVYSIILLLITGCVLLFIHIPYISDEFPHALGHAFIVAAILSATVDHYLKDRVLRDVSVDVAKYLIGYKLPEKVQDRIRELMQTKWVRYGFSLRLSFHEEGNKMKVEVRTSEEIQNITSDYLEYEDRIEWGKHEPFSLKELQCDSEDSNASYHLAGDRLDAAIVEENGIFIAQGKRVKIPPVSASSNITYCFRSRYMQLHPILFAETITFTQPTIGVNIEISDAPLDYSFSIDPRPTPIGHNRWEYKRLFTPGEHITIHWEKTNEAREKVEVASVDMTIA